MRLKIAQVWVRPPPGARSIPADLQQILGFNWQVGMAVGIEID